MRMMTKEFEIVKIRVEEGVDLGFEIKYSLLPNLMLKGETLPSFSELYVEDIAKHILHGHLPI